MDKRKYYMFLNYVPNIWNGVIKKLLEYYGDVEEIYEASEKSLISSGIQSKYVEQIIKAKKTFDYEKNMEYLEKKNIKIVTVEDEIYPKRLSYIEDKPYCLYVRGNLPDENNAVAIVGARACSNYGIEMAKKIGKELALYGINVISGMARGIDTFGQLGALSGGGKTYAVLGCGVDVCYPNENIELYERIIDNGGVISEYFPGTRPEGWRFPMRNRIISGLSDSIVVVEARNKSGSLITAEQAVEQGKDVYAVPGRINDELSIGCNKLINDGAHVIADVNDIVGQLISCNTNSLPKNEKINILNIGDIICG